MTKEESDFVTKQVMEHSKFLIQWAFLKTKDEQLAQDLVQQTFETLCKKCSKIQKHENPGGWLFRTLRYFTIKEMVRAHRRYERPMEESDLDLGGPPDISLSIDEYFPKGLSQEDQALFRDKFVYGLSSQEIADRIGISSDALRKRMFRLYKKFRMTLASILFLI